jgi:lantibiotic leader peptide-processing serine protease
MRTLFALLVASLVASVLLIPAATSGPQQVAVQEYVVLYESGASLAAARAAVKRIGGKIVRENRAIGLATIRTSNDDFVIDAVAQRELFGAARNRSIGTLGPGNRAKFSEERLDEVRKALRGQSAGASASSAAQATPFETFAPLQWDMAMIHATKYESHNVQPGRRGVLVGILDSGIDASHPDLAPNLNTSLARNFTTDIPIVDGPCEEEPDQSCSDPPTVDENGHGTHVAGIVATAANGLGVAGVAPKVTLVSLRTGQESGFVFLQPVVDALTFAGRHGIDVVNMSFYIDPWLFNCRNNPADSPEAQQEQRTVIAATNRALRFAHRRGVTLIGSEGNEHTDLGHPTTDETSPDFPPGSEYPRQVNNGCLSMPTEGFKVVSVSALGPSTVKADYSNYGLEQTAVSAPGGYFRDYLGTPQHMTPANLVLSAYPESVGREFGDIDENGNPTNPFVLKDCEGATCAFYQYLQGTSMAAPHATGVAALIVSEYGKRDRRHGGLTLNPNWVERILKSTATDHACPKPRLFSYEDVGRPPDFNAFCAGPRTKNGFYGHGIVNAYAAVLRGR